jgi:hypothetical protein
MTDHAEPRKFKKKPVEVEAMQYKPETCVAIHNWAGWDHDEPLSRCSEPCGLFIDTLEGDMQANFGDWIIKGIKGEFHPCKPDIFEATYEPAD